MGGIIVQSVSETRHISIEFRMTQVIILVLLLNLFSIAYSFSCTCYNGGPCPTKRTDCKSGELGDSSCGGCKKTCSKAKGEECGGKCNFGGWCAIGLKCSQGYWQNPKGVCQENTKSDRPRLKKEIKNYQRVYESYSKNIPEGMEERYARIAKKQLKTIRRMKIANKHICNFSSKLIGK